MNVRVVQIINEATLVEYSDVYGNLKRKIVPSKHVTDGTISDKKLEYGIDYGTSFADALKFDFNPAIIDNELHKRGIWTTEDVFANPALVKSAFERAVGFTAQKFFRNLRS